MISTTTNTIHAIFEAGFFYHPIMNNNAFLQNQRTLICCCLSKTPKAIKFDR